MLVSCEDAQYPYAKRHLFCCRYLYVGTQDGRLIVCTNPKMRLTMLSTAIDRTFIGII